MYCVTDKFISTTIVQTKIQQNISCLDNQLTYFLRKVVYSRIQKQIRWGFVLFGRGGGKGREYQFLLFLDTPKCMKWYLRNKEISVYRYTQAGIPVCGGILSEIELRIAAYYTKNIYMQQLISGGFQVY